KTPAIVKNSSQPTESLVNNTRAKIMKAEPIINPSSMGYSRSGVAYALLSGIIFAVMGITVQFTRGVIESHQLVFFRCLFGLFILAPWTYKEIGHLFQKQGWVLWLRGVAGSLAMIAFFWNLQHTTYGTAISLTLTAGIFVTLLSGWLLKEPLKASETIAILMVIAGAISLYIPEYQRPSLEVTVVGILGALLGAVALLSLRQAAKKYPPSLIVGIFYLMGILLAPMIGGTENWVYPSLENSPNIAIVAIGGLLAQLSMTRAFHYLRAPIAASIVLTRLLWGIFFEYLLTQHSPAPFAWIGYSLIIAGVMALQLASSRVSVKF
ncbi:MAG: DMT family transporter, partial [Myxococcota bacterium]|nr:DMT family transporter [Myxococcota bacterium]